MNIKIKRLKLKDWVVIDDIRREIREYGKKKNWSAVAPLIYLFIELSSGASIDFSSAPWFSVLEIYNRIEEENRIRFEFPILSSKQQGKIPPWDYKGRGVYFWINIFASRYGWTKEEILEMDIDDVVALWQEILVDEQIRQEWEWGLTEIAYPYNKSTKKSVFKPLGRPDWMLPTQESVKAGKEKTVRIRRDMLPIGNIVSLDGENAS